MAKDILNQYGRDTSQPQVSRATNGGQQSVKQMPYSPPKGPTANMERKVGLGGTNHGSCGTQGKR